MKREVTLVDQSAASIKVTFWGDNVGDSHTWAGKPLPLMMDLSVAT